MNQLALDVASASQLPSFYYLFLLQCTVLSGALSYWCALQGGLRKSSDPPVPVRAISLAVLLLVAGTFFLTLSYLLHRNIISGPSGAVGSSTQLHEQSGHAGLLLAKSKHALFDISMKIHAGLGLAHLGTSNLHSR